MAFFFPTCNARVHSKIGSSGLSGRYPIPPCSRTDRVFSIARQLEFPVDNWSFAGGSKILHSPQLPSINISRRCTRVHAFWPATSQIASSVFTVGTVSVLPFYTLMVVAPNSKLTKKSMESGIPYIILAVLYAYLLYLSWTPDTLTLMFANKYMLPELPGIAKMFSSEMTLASAWIHLLAIDLFAARQVYHDGLENQIETRHSVSLCLLFCPIGVFTHFITKALTKNTGSGAKHRL